jgi:signal transduction histidine kinase
MTRRSATLSYVLGIITVLLLLNTNSFRPNEPVTWDPQITIAMMGFVAFVVNVEVPLLGATLSLGYAASLLVYLCFGQADHNFRVYLTLFVGGAAGGFMRALWQNRDEGATWRLTPRLVENPMLASGQLVISVVIGNFVYHLLDGTLPLSSLQITDVLPLTLYILISMGVYLVIFWLSLRSRGIDPELIFKRNIQPIVLALLVPLPFVIAAARIYPISLSGFVSLITGLLFLAIGATFLGRNQIEYHGQLLELQSLSSVSRSMRTYLDLNALLSTLQLQVATLLDIDNFTLALYDPDRNFISFPLVTHRWQKLTVPSHELNNDLVDYVISTKAPLLLSDMPHQRAVALKLTPPRGNISSWLGVPMLAPDRALGCIAVYSEDPNREFGERELRLLTTIASQSAIAIENAQLYRQVQDRARQITRLNDLAAQLSGTLDPQRVLNMAAQSALLITGGTAAAVFLWVDEEKTKLTLDRSFGLKEDFVPKLPMPLSKNSKGLALAVQNVRTDPQVESIRDQMLAQQINAWVELPLANGDNQLGVLVSYFSEPRRISGDELELLRTFANQAALSISNARQHQRTDEALELRIEQLSVLATINKELSSTLNMNMIYNLMLDHAIEATRSAQGALLITEGDQLKVVATRGLTPDTAAIEHGVAASAFKSRLVASIAIGSNAQLGVPLMRDDKVYGVLVLIAHANDLYREDTISFTNQLATQALIAVDNARLFESMTESRNRLQVILDSMHEAVILFDLDGRIALANPRVHIMLNLEPQRIVGKALGELVAAPELNFCEQLGFDQQSLPALFEVLQLGSWTGGGRLSYRTEQPRVMFIDRTIVSVTGRDGVPIGVLMVFADATEERELAQAREDISRMIVHDLRSPLTAINASMKLLGEIAKSDDGLGRSIRKTTDVSQRALRKLLNLVDSLLDIAKLESGNITLETERVQLKTLAENVLVELSPLAEELDIEIKVDMPPELPQLVIDDSKIERVLLNLVDNALKFTPVSGRVEIRARREGTDKVLIEVCDTGPGVPDDYKKRIFDRFQQADQKGSHRRGTGLGLTFCRLAIEAHGGSIWIEDNPGGGSIFAFLLPLEVAAQGVGADD